MSQAFVRESDGEWLHDLPPTMAALIQYLVRENNGVRVYEKNNYISASGKTVHEMSNGMSYTIDEKIKWYSLD
ncbi:hypothetical protein BH11BAC1_BH11BAC1_09510 [soil metagenome]